MNEGFILIHRKIIKEWEWYSNTNDTRLWLHCLLKANWEDRWFEGIKVERGSFVTSLTKLSKELGLSIQEIRTSINHLKSTHNITYITNRQFSVITINKYNEYQLDNTQVNTRPTHDQHTTNNNIMNYNELNKYNNIYNISDKPKEKKKSYGEFKNVKLTDDEYNKLKEKFSDYEEKIENLSYYLKSKGDKYKSHYATILNWSRKDDKDEKKLPSWFNKEIKENVNEERKKLAEQLTNGTWKP